MFEDGFEVVATMPKRKDEDKGTDGGDGEGRPSKEAKIGVDAAPLLAAVDIREVMAKEGPLCTVVVLRAGPEKKKEELLLDFTPKKQAVQETLGGQITFMGMWAKRVQCVIIQRIDQEELEANNSAPVNEHKLQPPFHDVGKTWTGGRQRGRETVALCRAPSFAGAGRGQTSAHRWALGDVVDWLDSPCCGICDPTLPPSPPH